MLLTDARASPPIVRIGFKHNRYTETESPARIYPKPSCIRPLRLGQLVRHHLRERFRPQQAHAIHRTVAQEQSSETQVIIHGGPQPLAT